MSEDITLESDGTYTVRYGGQEVQTATLAQANDALWAMVTGGRG